MKAIKQRSGAAIAVDQSTKEQGFSTVRIMGDDQQQASARDLVHSKIGDARGPQTGVFEFKVEQSNVGWLIGRGGETINQIKEQTGVTVIIDQNTKEMGYSFVKIMPGPGAEMARSMIETILAQVESHGNHATSVHDIPIDQSAVGMLIGRGGETVRLIKEQSGATMVINQSTKDAGYSIARLAGTPEAIARAAKLVARKLEELGVALTMGAPQLQQAMGERGDYIRSSRDYDDRGSRELMTERSTDNASWDPPVPQFNAVPPPQFGAVPPPSFGAVPPPAQAAAADEYDPFAEGQVAPKADVYDPFAD